jgi:hypothetical protein
MEQSSDELCLRPDVAATNSPNLPFPDHRHIRSAAAKLQQNHDNKPPLPGSYE